MEALYSGGLIFDGERLLENHGVMVKGGRIVRLAPSTEFVGFTGKHVDTTGQTVLPGLIDCHIHICIGAEADLVAVLGQLSESELAVRAMENAQSTLRGGVTSARDLGGKSFVEITVRDAINAGRCLGPTLMCAGQLICMTGGHGSWLGTEADGAEEIVRAVRNNIKAGADLIKVIATGGVLTPNVDPMQAHFDKAELCAAVYESHRFDRRITAHALGAPGISNAVEAGIDSIEHGFQITDELVSEMVSKGIVLVPTISALQEIVQNAKSGIPDYAFEKASRFCEMHRSSIREFHAAGGTIAMGTDAGTPFNYHGNNVHELGYMVDYGLSPLEALQAATKHSGDLCNLSDRGLVREGYWADLLIVSGNPVQDISAVSRGENHVRVVKEGFDVFDHLGPYIADGRAQRFIHDEPSF